MTYRISISNMLQQLKNVLRSTFWVHIILSMVYKLVMPNRDTVFLFPKEGCWLTYNFTADYKMYYPYPEGIWHIINRKNEKIPKKYQKEGFVEVEDNDDIIDVGAFVGEFSCGVSDTANEIIACEPSPRTVHCLIKNTQKDSNITVVPTIISDRSEIKELHLSYDPTDNSILDVDSEYSGVSLGVPSIKISNIIEYSNIDIIDFLKVEAEGAEPEVLNGIRELPVRKVAVDAGAERYGEKTVDQVSSILTDAEFQVRHEKGMVYAKRDI